MFIPERRFVRRFVREERKITQEFLRGISITPREKFLLKLLSNKNPKTNILTTDQIEILVYSKNICKKCWTMGYHKLQCSCGSIDFWKNNPSSWRNITNKSLKWLYNNYCIDRFEPPVGRNEGSAPQHVILDRAGALLLNQRNFRKISYIPQSYQHDLKIVDFYCALELENLKNPQGEIIYWQQDPYTKRSFTLNNKRYTFRPDIFVIYKYSQNRIKIMFVECDNATESINRLKGKIRMYHNYFLSGVWRQEYWSRSIPNTFPLVVFLTTVKNDSSKLNRYSESIDSPIRFIFLTYDQLIDFQYKIYESSFGKKRSVLQSIESKILDLIG